MSTHNHMAEALRELIIMSKAEWGRYPVNTNGKLVIIKAETALAAHEALAAVPVEPVAPTGFLIRFKAEVADAKRIFGEDEDIGYLWKYTHGTKSLAQYKSDEHLDVVELFDRPETQAVVSAAPTKADADAWAERHDIRLSGNDLWCAFEDAATVHLLKPAHPAPQPQQFSCDVGCHTECSACAGDDATPPQPTAPQQAGEPDLWQYRTRPEWHDRWSDWKDCTAAEAADIRRTLKYGVWHYEVRSLPAATPPQPTAPALQPEPLDLDAWKCDRCGGDGWHWIEEEGCEPRDKVATKAHCDQCDGLGWCGPDALAAANQAKEKAHV